MTTTTVDRRSAVAGQRAVASSGTPGCDAPQATDDEAVWPQTLLLRAELADLAYQLEVGSQSADAKSDRRLSTDWVLQWLETLPGATWQQRWKFSGVEANGIEWAKDPARFVQAKAAAPIEALRAHRIVIVGIRALLCLGALRPGYPWLIACKLRGAYEHVRQLADPQLFAEAAEICRKAGHRERIRLDALLHLSRIMLHTGRTPRQLTVEDLLGYYHVVMSVRRQANSFSLSWDLLCELKIFPAGTPSLRHARHPGQRSVAEMVDAHALACRPIRDVLVRYLSERAASIDYSTLRGLVGLLVGAFWKDLEDHHPGIDSLRLAPDVAEAWKLRATRWRQPGTRKMRADHYTILFTVRAFYLDLAQWALEDPY